MSSFLSSARRAARAWPALVFVGACAWCLSIGWGRWGDLLVDTGRELEWPRRILAGERLYSDLRFNYGPLAPYVNALLYRVWGVKLEVLATAGVLSTLITVSVLYLIARRFVGRSAATLAGLLFFYACAFECFDLRAIFNWVLPHTFAATYGMMAAILSLYFLLRAWDRERLTDLGFSVFFLAAAAMSKVEALFPAAVAHSTFLVGSAMLRRVKKYYIGLYGAAVGAVCLIYGYFFHYAGAALWRDNLGGVFNEGSRSFILLVMGLRYPADNLAQLAIGSATLGISLLAGFGAALFLRSSGRGNWTKALIGAVAIGVVIALDYAVADSPDLIYRPLPVVMASLLVMHVVRWFREPWARAQILPDVLLFAFGLACVPRMILSTSPNSYGYFLLPPAILCLIVFLFRYLPGCFEPGSWSSRMVVATSVILVLGNAISDLRISEENLKGKTVPLVTPRGTMWLYPDIASDFLPLLRQISLYPAGTKLLVVPLATSINFLTGRPGVDGMFSHLPMDYYGGFSDASVRAGWERNPPDLIVFISDSMLEFGGGIYGRDYGTLAYRWIIENYRPVTDPREYAVLLERRGSAGIAVVPGEGAVLDEKRAKIGIISGQKKPKEKEEKK